MRLQTKHRAEGQSVERVEPRLGHERYSQKPLEGRSSSGRCSLLGVRSCSRAVGKSVEVAVNCETDCSWLNSQGSISGSSVNGAEGEGKVEAQGSERRVSRDGGHYTFDQFVDFFGGTEAQWYWDQAAISPGRTIASAWLSGLHRMTTTGLKSWRRNKRLNR